VSSPSPRTPRTARPVRRLTRALALGALALSTACATTGSGGRDAAAPEPLPSTGGTPAAELRLGYFPNVTHATAVYGDASGTFARALGDTRLTTQTFNAGPAAVEALFGGSLDATYIGPNPAINAFAKSQGEAIRIIAGATSGGASLVVRPEIADVKGLAGKRIATPQTGGTQDIALRHYLGENGYDVGTTGAGDVTVLAQENPVTLTAFQSGQIDGAWVPEPWASRLVLEGAGKVLVDERDLWPGGDFVTTHLVVRTQFLRDHPETVRKLVEGSVEANRQLTADPAGGRQVVNDALAKLTGKPLAAAVLERSFAGIEITDDPVAGSLAVSAQHAFDTGLVKKTDLTGIYDLTILREVLGRPVDDAHLGATPK
jgi:NitT/TauT family transport system substrate-binding protein